MTRGAESDGGERSVSIGGRTGREGLLVFEGAFAQMVPASLSESSEWVEECPVDEIVLKITDSSRMELETDAAELEFMYGNRGRCGTIVFEPEPPELLELFPSKPLIFFHSS